MSIDPALFQENERTAPTGDGRRYADVGSLIGLPNVTLAYETWGTYRGDNAVLIQHALSGDSHCVGWWSRMVGPGRPFDTERFYVVGTNVLGGCQGSTGPWAFVPHGSRFPRVTLGDMVEAQSRLLDLLGVPTLACVAGGSMGGMLALEWTARFPERVQKAFVTAAAARHSAMQIGFNEAARQAIRRDPKWRGGDYPANDGPRDGLSVARMIGHLSFLSDAAFETKFGRRLQEGKGDQFQVESYLNYQGDKFTTRFDANTLLVLTDAIDRYDWPGPGSTGPEFLFVSYTSDWIYPPRLSEEAHRQALLAGCRSRHERVDLPYGHDAFLLDGEGQGRLVREWLA